MSFAGIRAAGFYEVEVDDQFSEVLPGSENARGRGDSHSSVRSRGRGGSDSAPVGADREDSMSEVDLDGDETAAGTGTVQPSSGFLSRVRSALSWFFFPVMHPQQAARNVGRFFSQLFTSSTTQKVKQAAQVVFDAVSEADQSALRVQQKVVSASPAIAKIVDAASNFAKARRETPGAASSKVYSQVLERETKEIQKIAMSCVTTDDMVKFLDQVVNRIQNSLKEQTIGIRGSFQGVLYTAEYPLANMVLEGFNPNEKSHLSSLSPVDCIGNPTYTDRITSSFLPMISEGELPAHFVRLLGREYVTQVTRGVRDQANEMLRESVNKGNRYSLVSTHCDECTQMVGRTVFELAKNGLVEQLGGVENLAQFNAVIENFEAVTDKALEGNLFDRSKLMEYLAEVQQYYEGEDEFDQSNTALLAGKIFQICAREDDRRAASERIVAALSNLGVVSRSAAQTLNRTVHDKIEEAERAERERQAEAERRAEAERAAAEARALAAAKAQVGRQVTEAVGYLRLYVTKVDDATFASDSLLSELAAQIQALGVAESAANGSVNSPIQVSADKEGMRRLKEKASLVKKNRRDLAELQKVLELNEPKIAFATQRLEESRLIMGRAKEEYRRKYEVVNQEGQRVFGGGFDFTRLQELRNELDQLDSSLEAYEDKIRQIETERESLGSAKETYERAIARLQGDSVAASEDDGSSAQNRGRARTNHYAAAGLGGDSDDETGVEASGRGAGRARASDDSDGSGTDEQDTSILV